MAEVFVQHILELENLRGEIRSYCDQIALRYNLDITVDTRYIFLTQWDRVLMSYYLDFLDLARNTNNPQIIQNLFRTDLLNATEIIKDKVTYTKISFINIFASIIENFFRSVYKALINSNVPSSIYTVRSGIFTKLGLAMDSEEWKAFSILSNIRNTIHNNGIYTEPDRDIVFNGQTYNFRTGRPQTFADLNTIVAILRALMKMSKQIIEHSDIVSIPKILDPSSLFGRAV